MASLANMDRMEEIDSSDSLTQPRVAIIGGGYAGMAAAVSLIDAGITHLTVYEAGPVLGGRARRIPGRNQNDDNGQHLCLGAYTELLKLMMKVGSNPETLFYRSPLRLLTHRIDKASSKPAFSFQAMRFLPAPFNLVSGIVFSSGPSLGDRLQTLFALHKLRQRCYVSVSGQTVSGLLDELEIRGVLRHYFWESLCLAALNTQPEHACAQTFLNILQDIAEGAQPFSDLLIPKVDLSQLFPEPAAEYIKSQGAEIFTSCAVKALEPAGKLLRVLGTRHQGLYHHVVLATPPKTSARLIASWGADMQALSHHMLSLPHERIATLYLDYSGPVFKLPFPMMGIAHNAIEWIFDRSNLMNTGKSAITCIISAPSQTIPLDKIKLTQQAHACVEAICGSLPYPDSSRLVVEKQATLSCRPDIIRPDALTPDRRLILAGDYLRSRYPSTLETAVRSGLHAAELTLKHLRTDPTHFKQTH